MRYKTDNGGFYELNPFPCCNQIVVSNHAYLPKEMRGKGLGSIEHVKRLDKIKELGFDYVLCTVTATNEAQIKILERNSWRRLDAFFNRETGNTVFIYGRQMPHD